MGILFVQIYTNNKYICTNFYRKCLFQTIIVPVKKGAVTKLPNKCWEVHPIDQCCISEPLLTDKPILGKSRVQKKTTVINQTNKSSNNFLQAVLVLIWGGIKTAEIEISVQFET